MVTNPYQLPSHLLDTSDLVWEAFRHRARPSGGRRANEADLAGLLRLAIEGDFPLDLAHDGVSVLGAALSGWGLAPRSPPVEEVASLPVPREPPRALLAAGVLWPEAIAGALIHRGADPFVNFDRLVRGEEVPNLNQGPRFVSACRCPVALALESGLDSTLAQMLRHPQAPAASEWDGLKVAGLPWLHLIMTDRPRLLASWLNQGFNPNVLDDQGATALFRATHPEQVACLLKAGADPTISNLQGRVAPDMWQEAGIKQMPAMVAELSRAGKSVTSNVKPANSRVFDEVMRGVRGRVTKAPEKLQSPLKVTGFDQPLSLASHALVGVLVDTIRQPLPLFEMIWPRTDVGPVERALLSLAAFDNPVLPLAKVGYASQSTLQARERNNLWHQWLQDAVTASEPASAEEIGKTIPQMVAFMAARSPDLDGLKGLSLSLLRRLGNNCGPGGHASMEQMVYGSAIWCLADEIEQRQPASSITNGWDPWTSFTDDTTGTVIKADCMSTPQDLLYRLSAAQRHLTQVPSDATSPQWAPLIQHLLAWTPEQWADLIELGVADRFEDRMQACGLDLPWLGAWKASRREIKAQSAALDGPLRVSRARARP